MAAGDTTVIVIMAIWTVVFNIVQGNIVSPLVYGRTVQLHPAIVLLAIPAGGAIAGVIGMFLIVPFLGVIAVSWRTVLKAAGEAPTVEPTGGPDGALPEESSPSDARADVEARGATTGGAIEPAS